MFGSGDIAQLAHYYFTTDSELEVCAFTVDRAYLGPEGRFEGLPLVAFEEVECLYPPSDFDMFVAVSYAQMNRLRQRKFEQALHKGYRLRSYISSRCSYLSQFAPGPNAFILEDNTVQPFVKIGDNVTLWSGNHVGHHSLVGSHTFVSSQVVIAGHCSIGTNCFLGVNATLAHGVTLAPETLLGAGATVTRDTEPKGVYLPARSVKIDRTSDQIDL
ncbi:MAG: acetyltransferase [Myxococcales bacterium]|nr:acetyltransferase [Myxococcales bacterium]